MVDNLPKVLDNELLTSQTQPTRLKLDIWSPQIADSVQVMFHGSVSHDIWFNLIRVIGAVNGERLDKARTIEWIWTQNFPRIAGHIFNYFCISFLLYSIFNQIFLKKKKNPPPKVSTVCERDLVISRTSSFNRLLWKLAIGSPRLVRWTVEVFHGLVMTHDDSTSSDLVPYHLCHRSF
jgi:hypothetical protein